jgi:hypothetical protein
MHGSGDLRADMSGRIMDRRPVIPDVIWLSTMVGVDREYAYGPTWMATILVATLFGGAAFVLASVAATNDRGLVVNGIVCVLGLGFAAASVFVLLHRCTHHQKIVLTPNFIILPKTRWSAERAQLHYDEISALSNGNVHGLRFFDVLCNDGTKFRINAALLPPTDAFDEIREELQQQIDRGAPDAK